MSKPSNIRSSGGMCRFCRGRKHVNLGASAVLLSSSLLSSSSSSSLSSSADRAAGVGAGVGGQWLLRRTARPVLSDSLNASRVLRRRIYNRVYKHCLHSFVLMRMMFIGCQHGGIYVVFLLCRYWNIFTRNLNHACHKVPRADVWWNVPSRKESDGWL